jgi:hypothetical protein
MRSAFVVRSTKSTGQPVDAAQWPIAKVIAAMQNNESSIATANSHGDSADECSRLGGRLGNVNTG